MVKGGKKRKWFGASNRTGGVDKRFKGCISSAVFQSCSRGVLITHDRNKEGFCRNDAFGLFNYFADKWYGEENKMGEKDSELEDEENLSAKTQDFVDVEAEIAAELEKSKKASKDVTRRFISQKVNCNNIVFIQFNSLPDQPSVFVQKVIAGVEAAVNDKTIEDVPSGRACLRLHPVEAGCKAQLDEIRKAAKEYFPQAFKKVLEQLKPLSDSDGFKKEYNFVYRCRNNDTLGMHIVTEAMVEVAKDVCPEWRYNCRSYDIMITVDIICAVCSMSVVKNYGKLKKFNLRTIKGFQHKKKDEKISEVTKERSSDVNNMLNAAAEEEISDKSQAVESDALNKNNKTEEVV